MFKVAQVLKSNGTDGELVIGFRNVAPEDIQAMEPVFLYFEGLPVPFFIEALRRRGTDKALVRLNDIHSLEDADELAGADLLMRASSLPGDEQEDGLLLEDLPGWTIASPDGRTLGVVTDFEDIPGNPCLYVETPGGQAMIPLHEDFILSADEKERVLTLDLPEGLL
jgi:16S rRNA processing protein RimM